MVSPHFWSFLPADSQKSTTFHYFWKAISGGFQIGHAIQLWGSFTAGFINSFMESVICNWKFQAGGYFIPLQLILICKQPWRNFYLERQNIKVFKGMKKHQSHSRARLESGLEAIPDFRTAIWPPKYIKGKT